MSFQSVTPRDLVRGALAASVWPFFAGDAQHGDDAVGSNLPIGEFGVEHLNARLRDELAHVLVLVENRAGLSQALLSLLLM